MVVSLVSFALVQSYEIFLNHHQYLNEKFTKKVSSVGSGMKIGFH